MKLQIINLDAEDDHVSTRDKLSWSKADRAVLVWPRRGNPLARRIDLALVQRYARRRGIELGLIAHEPSVRTNAAHLGIPVFDSLDALPAGTWAEAKSNGREFSRRSPEMLIELRGARDASLSAALLRLNQRGRIAVVATVVVALLVVASVLIPSAEVVIVPSSINLRESVEVLIDPEFQNGPQPNRIPGHRITTVVSGEMQAETSGSIRQPSTISEGKVVFTNLTDEPVSLPVGTGIRAGEIRFLTLRSLSLEGEAGSTGTASIAAALPGLSGNVAAGAIDAVEGPIGFLVQVSNPSPTFGGRDIRAIAVSDDDRLELREQLVAALLTQAEAELEVQLGESQVLVPGSLLVSSVLEQQYDRDVGEAAPSLTLNLVTEVEGITFALADAVQTAETHIAESLPSSRFVIPESVVINPTESSPRGDATLVELQIQAQVARRIDFTSVRQNARAIPIGQAGSRLKQSFSLAEPAQITVNPRWAPWLPLLEMRIAVHWAWESTG